MASESGGNGTDPATGGIAELGAEALGALAEVLGEVGDGGDVGADGAGGVVAEAEVVDESLT